MNIAIRNLPGRAFWCIFVSFSLSFYTIEGRTSSLGDLYTVNFTQGAFDF